MPLEILETGHFVPGFCRAEMVGRYQSKKTWQVIMTVSEEACISYASRMCKDFDSSVSVKASNKAKAGPTFLHRTSRQKQQQKSVDRHLEILDAALLWEWLRPKLQEEFTGETVNRLVKLWEDGLLGTRYERLKTTQNPSQSWSRSPTLNRDWFLGIPVAI